MHYAALMGQVPISAFYQASEPSVVILGLEIADRIFRDFLNTFALCCISHRARYWSHNLMVLLYALVFAVSLPLVGVPRVNSRVQSEDTQNASTATRLKSSLSNSRQTQYVSCWDKKNKLTGSHLVRTPIFASSDGSQRAYVEVEATAFQPRDLATYTGPLCENTSRLFFAGSGETKFKLVFSQSQEDFSDGNSLTLVDWSFDGRQLLMERTQWKYESEGDYTDFVVFNADSGTVTQPNLEAAIATRYGKDCGSQNSILGFTSEGKIVLALAPLADDVALMNGAKSCVKRKTLLAVDLNRGIIVSMEPLISNFKLARYGNFVESAVKQQ